MVSKSKRGRPKSKTVTPPTTGPVTLEEARALAAAKKQKRVGTKAGAQPTTTATSPADVGAQRQVLEKRRDQEIARRIRDYKDTMSIMKKRGARPPKRAKRGAKGEGPEAKSGGFRPLQILAEGDSWFDYPVPFFGGGIIPRLETRIGVPILNLAKAGDEVRYMLGVKERGILSAQLTAGSPAGGPWDVLLFSGGGNDIVGDPMALWVRDFDPTVPPEDLVSDSSFKAALALVRAGYEDLIAMRDRLSPNTHLVFHAYDFAIPDGRGVCGVLGPWLKPTFDIRGFPTRAAAQAVVRAMLLKFADMLSALEAQSSVTFLNGQGTLAAQTSSWHNELHPSAKGFEKFAALFHEQLRILFPSRVA